MVFTVTHFFLFLVFFFFSTTAYFAPHQPYPYGLAYLIDCGSATNTTNLFNTTWLSDRFYTGGVTDIVFEPLRLHYPYEKTLCFFHVSYGKNVYIQLYQNIFIC
ncbi:hypothetical protein K1719_027464 [Acacia pycnantha]|nr:hypothetical protein K1719_027464 [Acacia pycnantha]